MCLCIVVSNVASAERKRDFSQTLNVKIEDLLRLWSADIIFSVIHEESDLADKTLQMVIETRNTIEYENNA